MTVFNFEISLVTAMANYNKALANSIAHRQIARITRMHMSAELM